MENKNELLCITERDGEFIKCECDCPNCGEHLECSVKLEDYKKWLCGRLQAHEAFPYINIDLREMFISGLCSKCWIEKHPDEI